MMKISDLPDNVQKVVRKIKIGKPSDPVIAGGGVMVFMACSRTQPQSTIPGRDQVSRQIEFKRLDLLSQRYLRDLRRAAHIDIRIK
jgi:peptidyl-prolyl cis-trans isomerase SurA